MDLILGKKFGLSDFNPGMIADLFDELDPTNSYIAFMSQDHD